MTGYILAILVLICCSAFFSAAEMSVSSANRMRLENARDEGSRPARAAVAALDHYDDALSAILIGNNMANIAMSSVSSVMAIVLTGGEDWNWLATLIITVVVIIFGETVPKILAKKNANRLALAFAYIIRGLMLLLKPVVFLVVGLVRLITLPMKGENAQDAGEGAVEELQSIIETAEDEDVLDEDRSELLQAALDFSQVSASEAMTARVDVVAIDIDDDWEDIIRTIDGAPYSRLPVYEGSIDNIIGFLYINHFLKAMVDNDRPDIRSLLMAPLYVYKTIRLPQVLAELRRAKKHLAVVTDEYGGTLGVISMEDVLEQIVGDIWDETDEVETEVVHRSDGCYELDGDMTIADFLELVGIPEGEFDFDSETVGGWTIEMFGAFPKVGQSFTYRDLTVTALTVDGQRVERVLVKKMSVPPDEKKKDE